MSFFSHVRAPLCVLGVAVLALFAHAQASAQGGAGAGRGDTATGGLAVEDEALRTLLKQLAVEVRELRIDLNEQQLEREGARLARLERELRRVQADRKRLEEQEGAINAEIAELDNQLSRSTLTEEERAGVEAARADLVGSSLDRVRAEQQVLAGRETEVASRLERERKRRQELVKEGVALRGEAGELGGNREPPARAPGGTDPR